MDDRIRVSDADREHVTDRLREHFAQGRLSSEELDERITATLSAKTYGDLRRVMADLPEPGLVRPQASWPTAASRWPTAAPRPRIIVRRGPRLLPLAFIALIAAVAIPGAGWVFFAFLQFALAFWLLACVAGIFAASRYRRHLRRHWQSGDGPYWHQYQWHG
jgi:Domain of unknown function (DUF1707)